MVIANELLGQITNLFAKNKFFLRDLRKFMFTPPNPWLLIYVEFTSDEPTFVPLSSALYKYKMCIIVMQFRFSDFNHIFALSHF